MTEERRDIKRDAPNVDWWRVHSLSTEGHPAGTGERSAPETGGPVAAQDAQ